MSAKGYVPPLHPSQSFPFSPLRSSFLRHPTAGTQVTVLLRRLGGERPGENVPASTHPVGFNRSDLSVSIASSLSIL